MMTIVKDIFGDTVRGGYGAEDDDEWVTVPVNLIPGQMVTMLTLKVSRFMRITRMKNMILVRSLESLETMSDVLKYDDHDAHDDDRDYNFFLEDDGCEPMKGPRSEPQMMSMHEEHKKIEVGNPLKVGPISPTQQEC